MDKYIEIFFFIYRSKFLIVCIECKLLNIMSGHGGKDGIWDFLTCTLQKCPLLLRH